MSAQKQARATLEEMVFQMWQRCIDDVADYADVLIEAVQKLIADTRGIVTDAGCPMAAASIQDRERNAMWRTPCRIPPSMASHFSMGE